MKNTRRAGGPGHGLVGWAALTVLSALVLGAPAGAQDDAVSCSPSARKRALIVAVAEYQHSYKTAGSDGWLPLNSGNDAPLIEERLRQHGFQDIVQLADQKATKSAIMSEWRKLVERADPGDTLVLHFSGHGQQVTDQDPLDEPDGLDEALVPYEAPMAHEDGYDGSKHLRDDELRGLLDEARRQVGPRGSVVAWVDACYSGSIGRGEARRRGAARPNGEPHRERPRFSRGEGQSGIVDEEATGRGAPVPSAASRTLAPYVVFSAAAYDTEAKETYDRDRDYLALGSLSYGLARALPDLTPASTYQDLFDQVAQAMRSNRVPNEPQPEGSLNTTVFSGCAVAQAPFHSVTRVTEDGKAWIDAGYMSGVRNESTVEVHRAGARRRTPEALLAEGVVDAAKPLSARVAPTTEVEPDDLETARVFVTKRNYGDTKIRVRIAGDSGADGRAAGLRQRLETRLQKLKVNNVELAQSGEGDLTIQLLPNDQLRIERTDFGSSVLGPVETTRPDLLDVVGNRLQDFALNRYLYQLEVDSDELDVDLEIVPVELGSCQDPEYPDKNACDVTYLDGWSSATPGQATFQAGQYFALRVHNHGTTDANVAILDLRPDGTIGSLWQVYQQTDKQRFPGGTSRELDPLYRFDPMEWEAFLLVATNEWINTDLIVTPPHEEGPNPAPTFARGARARGRIGPLDPMMSQKARTRTYYDPQLVQTKRIDVKVVSGE